MPPVSFVILSFNTLDYTKQCIDSIRAECKAGSYELVIIDNASTDGSIEWLEQQEDITGIRDYHNLHYFSLSDMTTLLQQTGYQISRIKRTITEDFSTNAHKDFFDKLLANESSSAREQYDAHYYLIQAIKQ